MPVKGDGGGRVMAGEDDDKTVFGQPLPKAARRSLPPSDADQTRRAPLPGAEADDKTVFGQPLHPYPDPGQGPDASDDKTRLGGPLPQPVPPAWARRVPEESARAPVAFQAAAQAVDLGGGGASNPLIYASTNLMILLGRLRTGRIEMQTGALIEHVAREIEAGMQQALQAGVPPQDVQDAKYALSATADDILENLPGLDRRMWQDHGMALRFFGDRQAGVGFYRVLDAVMRTPAERYLLLELMLHCLSLGFEGQYRTIPSGAVEREQIRLAVHARLRRARPQQGGSLSVRWRPVVLDPGARRKRTPLWIIGSVAAAMVVALFATLSTLLVREGAEVRTSILSLHSGYAGITIERTEPVLRPFVAPQSAQLQRIREGLAPEIDAGLIEVDRNQSYIFVRLGRLLQFGSGSAVLQSDIADLSLRIGRALDGEAGPIRVVGHTDSIPASGRGRYKTNEALSVARAQTVAEILGRAVAVPARIEVEGKGAVDPIADNSTRDGRARNRRVEILILRED